MWLYQFGEGVVIGIVFIFGNVVDQFVMIVVFWYWIVVMCIDIVWYFVIFELIGCILVDVIMYCIIVFYVQQVFGNYCVIVDLVVCV